MRNPGVVRVFANYKYLYRYNNRKDYKFGFIGEYIESKVNSRTT